MRICIIKSAARRRERSRRKKRDRKEIEEARETQQRERERESTLHLAAAATALPQPLGGVAVELQFWPSSIYMQPLGKAILSNPYPQPNPLLRQCLRAIHGHKFAQSAMSKANGELTHVAATNLISYLLPKQQQQQQRERKKATSCD